MGERRRLLLRFRRVLWRLGRGERVWLVVTDSGWEVL